MSLRVLFIGGTGVISSACAVRAVAVGIELHVLNRGESGLRPVPAGVPSPKAQLYEVTVPSLSAEPDPSNATDRFVAVEVNAAVGFWFTGGGAVTVTGWTTLPVADWLSVTVRVTW